MTPSKSPEFDIVVVAGSEHVELCLESIAENSEIPKVRVTVVDNRLGEEIWDCYRRICPYENVGWDKALNAGLALSTAPYVVMMNDDTEVKTAGWLEILRSAFHDHQRLGVLGPLGGNGAQDPGRFANVYAPTVVVREPELSLSGFGIGSFPLSSWCLMVRRECLVEVGYMDERFAHGYGASDDDWLARAHLAGWQMGIHMKVLVEHVGGGTFGERRGREQGRNEKLLKEKWRNLI